MKQRLFILGILAVYSANVAAEEADSHCYVPMIDNQIPSYVTDTQAIYINADESESWSNGNIKLRGDIELIQGERVLTAEQAEYQADTQQVSAEGDIQLADKGLLLKGKRILLDSQGNSATVEGGEYQMLGRPGRGTAAEISIEGPEYIKLTDASYTTCPPGDDMWRFRAGSIELMPEENLGIAKNMRLEVLGIPVVYLPYINFPLGERKTGILAPSIGSSDLGGSEIEIPFYLNIAPDRDATFSVKQMSLRGSQLKSEFRYLAENSYGQLDIEYLDNDKLTKKKRHFFQYQHQSYSQAWQTRINLQQVSDESYFRELSSDSQRLTSSLLESNINLSYHDDSGFLSLDFQHYQKLDDQLLQTNQPTKRLPQLRFALYSPYAAGLKYTTQGELAYFQQADGFNALRLDLTQQVSHYYGDSSAYIKPMLTLRGTAYWLGDDSTQQQNNMTRALPAFSLDSGLWFEREQEILGKHYRQSLEPRLYYLHIPYRNQQALPEENRLLDTQISEFDFDSLFSENRYSGVDRVGDDQRLAFSIGSRWFDDEGLQRLRLRIGQAYHFVEQQVVLADEEPVLKGWSNLLGGIDGKINRFLSSSGLVEWSADDQEIEKSGIQFLFQRDIKRRVALGLNYRRQLLKQASLQIRWPLNSRWSVMSDTTYSLHDNETRNAQLGLEYDGCCWRVRMAAQQYISSSDGSQNSGVAIQFELKGLTSVGSKINGFAEN